MTSDSPAPEYSYPLVPDYYSTPGWLTVSPLDANDTASWKDIVHPYWKQWNIDELVPDSWHYAVAAWMTFFGILGVLGNALVIAIFSRTKRLRTPSNVLIINLAFSDMTFSAINGFPLLTISSVNKRWVWGKLACEIYGFSGGIFGLMSINTLTWIAVDRYYMIAQPMNVDKRLTFKRAFVYIIMTWLWCAMWSVPPFFGWGAYIPEGFQTSCTFDYLSQDVMNATFVVGLYFGGFLLPVVIIVFSYIGIVNAVMKHQRSMAATTSSMGASIKKNKEQRMEIQTAKVAAINIGTYLLSWVPYAVVALVGMFSAHEEMRIHPLLSEIPVMLAKASAAYNPIIYGLSHPKFQVELYKLFPCLFCGRVPKSLAKATSVSQATATSDVFKEKEKEKEKEEPVHEKADTEM